MKLSNELKNFHRSDVLNELEKQFKELSKSFLYGGHIEVGDEFKIFIRTVEFYYHSETFDGIHDPIVYHRNGRDVEHCPYFPIMSLHAHSSGFDITFENEKEQYRASALIRAYEVKTKDGKYLKWKKISNGEWMFTEHDDYQYNSQSTYLYALINGFSIGEENHVRWRDELREAGTPIIGTRQNVYLSVSDFDYKPFVKDDKDKDVKCDRKWSFTRQETV